MLTEGGHVLIDISRRENANIFLTSKKRTPEESAAHLHKYFAHASSKKIGEVLEKSSLDDKFEIIRHLKKLDETCTFCLKYKREFA